MQVWEVSTGRVIHTYISHPDNSYAVAWSPDGKRLAAAGPDMHVWQADKATSWDEGTSFPVYVSATNVAWSTDSIRVAPTGTDVRIWRTNPSHPTAADALIRPTPTNRNTWSVALLCDSKYIASVNDNAIVKFWLIP